MSAPVSPSPLRAWFDLARAGNFPSVWSNVLAALTLSSATSAWPDSGLLVPMLVGGTLAYAGGTTLNDVFDAGFDRKHKPDRPIPAGVISRGLAGAVGTIQLAAGLLLIRSFGAATEWVLGLGAAILLYDWLHKRWAGSVLIMAACRACLALSLASLPGQGFSPAVVAWVIALYAYIVGLSVLARREYVPGAPAARIGRQVGRLLAFIPLVDAIALLLVGAWPAAAACALAVPTSRLAQRLAASN